MALFQGYSPAIAQTAYFPQINNGNWQYLIANDLLSFCRLGINGHLGSYPIRPLRLGWYLDYSALGSARFQDRISYFPMLRLAQIGNNYTYSLFDDGQAISASQLQATIAARPGTYWFIGNEPDRRQLQDDIEPEVYARAYHELYHLIKGQDPTAKVVAGTIVQPTPLRLEYLDKVLQNYSQFFHTQMPVDAWAFHNFILNEDADDWGAGIPPGSNATKGIQVDVDETASVEIFKQQVIDFRQWMAARGYRNTPAFLSEFGVLFPNPPYEEFTVDVVNEFMNETFTFLMNSTDPNIGYPGDENRLIQRFAWYSVDDNKSHNGHLFNRFEDPATSRNEMGDNFVNFANAIEERVDFFPISGSVINQTPISAQGTTTVTLEAKIGNSGNLGTAALASVRFYNGDPNNGGVQLGTTRNLSLQGCGEFGAVQTEWPNVTPGNYTLYVQVTTTAGLEADPADDQITFPVTITSN
jgi:hypothetical protein